jgi:hypothetical protein
MSVHPTTTSEEITMVCDSIKDLATNHKEWAKEYQYDSVSNEFAHKNDNHSEKAMVKDWFSIKNVENSR